MPLKNREEYNRYMANYMKEYKKTKTEEVKKKLDDFSMIQSCLEDGTPFYFTVLREDGKVKEFGTVKEENLPMIIHMPKLGHTPNEMWVCRKLTEEEGK